MKKTLLFGLLLICSTSFSQVGIGTTAPETDAILELKSDDKALILPRVNSTGEIANPINGMLIYDISAICVKGFENGGWSGYLSTYFYLT